MGACRESRKSERHFKRVITTVLAMDKLLWLGSDHHMEDLREYARQVHEDIDFAIEERQREIDMEIKRRDEKTQTLDKFPPQNMGELARRLGGQPIPGNA